MNLYEELKSTNIFTINEFFTKYVDIIQNNKSTVKNIHTNKHHIIPRSYYKLSHQKINNSKDNLVNLSRSDHILAHYYLCFCIKDTILNLSMNYAFICMTNEHPEDFDIVSIKYYQEIYDKWYLFNKEMIQKNKRSFKHSEEAKKRISDAHKNLYKNHIWINKDGLNKHVAIDQLSQYIDAGFTIGRDDKNAFKKISERQKLNPNMSMLGKHQTDYQKQMVSIKLSGINKSKQACMNMSKAHKNKYLMSNPETGVSKYIDPEMYDEYIKQGFIRGRLKKSS